MTDEREIKERLERSAALLPGPRFGLGEVMGRGRRRRFRSRLVAAFGAVVVAAGAVAVLLATGVVSDRVVTDDAPQVVRPETGPEPLFDTTPLGTEVRLLDFEPPASDLERIGADIDLADGHAILAVGRVEGTSARVYRAFGRLEPVVDAGGGPDAPSGLVRCEWVFDDAGIAGPSCFALPLLDIRGMSVGAEVQVWVGLPESASVVVFEVGGTVSWQRPRGGIAVLPAPVSPGVPVSGLEVFDRFGVPLGIPPEFRRDPMPDGAEVFTESLPTPELETLADLQPGDLLYQIPVGDRIVLVRLSAPVTRDGRIQSEPPLLFATSCDVAHSVPLPRRWRGGCLERTVDGDRVHGTFLYGTDLPFGEWTDDGWGEATGSAAG